MEDVAIVLPIALTFLLCSTGVATYAIKMIFGNRGNVKAEALMGEIKALREEIQTLKRQNNDLVLALDTSLSRMDQRLTHVETRGQLGAGTCVESEVAQMAVQRR